MTQPSRTSNVKIASRTPRGWPASRSWSTTYGPDAALFPEANPSRALLDSLVPDRAAYLVSADVHAAWANSRALAAAGVTGAAPDPPRGRMERDPFAVAPQEIRAARVRATFLEGRETYSAGRCEACCAGGASSPCAQAPDVANR